MPKSFFALFAAVTSTVFAAEQWIKVNPTGTPPPGMGSHSVLYDGASNRLIVCCGYLSNRVWVLTNANGLGGIAGWTELSPTGGPPAPRAQQMAAYDQANNRLIVYGGYTTGGPVLTDLWVLTNANGLGGTPQWMQLSYGGAPPQRIGVMPAYDGVNNRMILFGGCAGPNGLFCFSQINEVWVLSNANGLGGTPQFTRLLPTGGPPAARGLYGIGYDGTSNRLIMFGGNSGVQWLNDTWVLTNANGLGGMSQWIQLSPATIPPARYDMSSAYDSAANQLYVVGGPSAGLLTNDVWRMDDANGMGTPNWVRLFPAGGPPPLWDSIGWVSAFDPANKRMMIFGGTDQFANVLNDVWVLVLGPPADTTPPVITPNITPAPNGAVWNNSAVTVTWNVGDPESGIASSTGCAETILSAETGGTTLTCSATNGASLSASAAATIKIDKTAPSVSLTSPGAGANYLLGASVTASYSCTDALSGIASCAGTITSGSNIDTSTPGSNRSFAVTATDVAGNSTTVANTYNVVYSFNGFLPPIANLPVLNVVRAGRTVPVKWQLRDANGSYVSSLSAVTSLSSASIACSAAPSSIVGETTESTGGSSLRYDPASNQFVYNWETLRSWTGCRVLQLALNDGTIHLAMFSFE